MTIKDLKAEEERGEETRRKEDEKNMKMEKE